MRSVSSQGSPPAVTDDFNDNSLDTAKWNANSLFSGYIDVNIPIAETGQRLEIGPLLADVPDSHYRGIRSINTYNFSGAYCYVELVQPASSTTEADAMFTVGNDVNNYYRLYVSKGTLHGLRKIGGSKTTLFSLPYDPVNHRFLRIRHEATGSVSLDTAAASGETPGPWVQRYSEIWSSSISLTATIFELKGGTWQREQNAPGKVIFDNFRFGSNSGSPPTVTAISPNSGTINGGTLVNITGTRFTSGATVSLGGSVATNVTVLSSSSIIATTSAHSAGTIDVVVTNQDGQSGTFANAYTYSSAPPPQTGLVADDFNDNLLDTAKWNPNSLFSGYIDLNTPISETGQRLEIGPLLPDVPDSHYRGVRSVNTYNFNGAYSYVELVQPPASNTDGDAMFTLGNDVNNYYRLYVEAGTLYGLRKAGGVKTTLFTTSYDPVNHRFLRIRHDALTGNLTLDTAAGSGGVPGTWVQQYAEAWNSSISLTATIFELKGGTWKPETNPPGKVIFDNFRAAVPGAGGEGLSLPILATLLDPLNRTGGTGENPLSRNFNFNVPLLGLPGRAGLDLNLSLAYNSLVWLNTGYEMVFNADVGFPSPGFRLGFPALQVYQDPEFISKNSYLLLYPDGSRTQFRRVGLSSLYESTDSTYALLDTATMMLRTADGTQLSFVGGRCTQIKDRNGNYITINYDGFGRIDTVVDTLSRTIKFNYDAFQTLASITQNWTINGQSQEHTWASFSYTNLPIQTNFPDLYVPSPQNGSSIRVLTQVIVNDGSHFNFEYTSWGQVWKIRNHASDGHLLNYRSYDLPQTNAVALQDCPRFTERRDWAENWNRSGALGPTGLPAGPEQEVITHYDVPASVSWTPPNGSLETGTLARVTAPDGTYNKIYFAGADAASTWRRGLPAYVETYNVVHELQRQVVTTWTQDTATSTTYEVNPRVTETNTYDPSGNRVRVVIGYKSVSIGDGTTCKLPQDIDEYQANASTLLRRTHTEYDLAIAYTTRRIIGLPSEKTLYEVDTNTLQGTLMSKLVFNYDESPIQGAADPTVTQHDNTNFGVSFLVGRANLTSMLRYNVDDEDNTAKATTTTYKYNRGGSLVSSKDALGHEVTFSYTDEFATNAGPTEADPLDAERPFTTLAYPTKVTDADGYSTKVRYNYDYGARTWQQTPLPNVTTNMPGPVQTFTYDVIGRLVRTTTLTNNAFTRYNYGPNYVETFSSINSILESANEGHTLIVFDGLGRTIANTSDHPNSTAGSSAQLILYDRMGRVQKRSNPTETSISITGISINPAQFQPLGDDALPNGGWNYVEQTYDWKGRPLVTTNQDGSTKTAEYTGCGCAGGEVVTLTDEGTIDGGVAKRRQQKIYSDVLGRIVKTEVLNWQGGTPYSTTVNTYNARDQLTRIREYAGLEGSSIYQEAAMTYDGYGRLLTAHRPEQDSGTSTTYAYNADDTVLSVTDARGAAATYAYNGRHLTTGITYTASGSISVPPPVTYSYDAAANRLWMNEDAQRRVTYHYTMLSLMDWEERKFPGLSGDYRLSYDYNLAGQVNSITDPTNSAINYVRDRAGRVTSVTGTPYGTGGINGAPYIEISQYASNLKYRAWGRLRSLTYGNQMTLSQEFDRRLRLSSFLVGGMTTPPNAPPGWETRLRSSNFLYYDDGNLRAALDNLGNVMDRAYSYDQVNRAKEAYSGSEALDFLNGTNSGPPTGTYRQSYQFDPFGNMTSRTNRFWSQTDTFTATYSNNRRQGIGIIYDAEGNLTDDADLQYTYDAAGRSASIFNPATNKTISPVYDGDGQVVNRTEIEGSSTSLNFFQLRSTVMGGKVITELDSQGQKKKGYVYCDGQLIARQDHLWIVWQHDDPFTGSRAGSNRDGAGAVEVDPDPMGVDLGSADPYVEPQLWEPPPEGMVGLLPGSGIPSGRCMLDGMSIECRQAGHLLQIGAAEFEHPTTVWDNGAWHFVEFNHETGEDEIPFDGDPLEELAPYLGRPIDSSANSLSRLFALNFSQRAIPQNRVITIPLTAAQLRGLIQDRLKYGDCAEYVKKLIGQAEKMTSANNPRNQFKDIPDLFDRIVAQPKGGFRFEAATGTRIGTGSGSVDGHLIRGDAMIRITPVRYYANSPAYVIRSAIENAPYRYGITGLHEVIHHAGKYWWQDDFLTRVARSLEPEANITDWDNALQDHCLPANRRSNYDYTK